VSENPPNSEPIEAGAAQAPPAIAPAQGPPAQAPTPTQVPTPSSPPPVTPVAEPATPSVQPPPQYAPASAPPPHAQPQAPQATPSVQPPTAAYEPSRDQISHRRRNTAALVLIVLGVVFLVGQFLPSWSWDKWWPLILILIGAYIIFQGRRRKP
jgi:hypothetical protein